MASFLQLLAAGLALGAVYALVALGFVVIYRASQVFNFAQGEFLTLGAIAMVMFSKAGLPWFVALGCAMVVSGLVGAGVEKVLLRPLIGRPVFVTIIVTIFVGFLMRIALVLVLGGETEGMPTPWDRTGDVEIFGASILYNSLAAITAAGLALGAFFVAIKYSKIGVAMRATSNDQEVALAMGIPVGRIFGATWFVAGALAALGGVFLGMFPHTVTVNLGYVALRAFPAVIVGGLESPAGAVIAGVLLGVTEVLAQGYVNPHLGEFGHDFHTVFPYLVMIGFLVFRPYGLFGQEEVERV
jgi:branched-chain amino acid transport system permease protein